MHKQFSKEPSHICISQWHSFHESHGVLCIYIHCTPEFSSNIFRGIPLQCTKIRISDCIFPVTYHLESNEFRQISAVNFCFRWNFMLGYIPWNFSIPEYLQFCEYTFNVLHELIKIFSNFSNYSVQSNQMILENAVIYEYTIANNAM